MAFENVSECLKDRGVKSLSEGVEGQSNSGNTKHQQRVWEKERQEVLCSGTR